MNAGWGGGGGGGVLVPDGFIYQKGKLFFLVTKIYNWCKYVVTHLKKDAQNIRALAFFLLLQKRQKYQLSAVFL